MDTNATQAAALLAAAKFVQQYRDEIYLNAQFVEKHLKAEFPSATTDAVLQTRKETDQIHKDLDAALKAMEDAGIDL